MTCTTYNEKLSREFESSVDRVRLVNPEVLEDFSMRVTEHTFTD